MRYSSTYFNVNNLYYCIYRHKGVSLVLTTYLTSKIIRAANENEPIKCDFDYSEFSMDIDCKVIKLRIFALVINTGHLINERTTLTLNTSQALLAPIAIFTVYIFIGIFLLGCIRHRFPSPLFEAYALLMCSLIEICLAIQIFHFLKGNKIIMTEIALVLNGILPILLILILSCDLILSLFSRRSIYGLYMPNPRPTSSINLQTEERPSSPNTTT